MLLRQLFEGGRVLQRVRVAEEDQRAPALTVAVEAAVRVGAVDPHQAAFVVHAGAIGRRPQGARPDRGGVLLWAGLVVQRGGALDLGERRRGQGRLQVGEQEAGGDPYRHAGEADREGAVRPQVQHPGEANRVLDPVVGGGARNPGGGDDRDARRDRQRPPEHGGEDQRRPVPEVPGVGESPDVADRRQREQARRRDSGPGMGRSAGEDHAGGADGGQQGRDTREGRARVEGEGRVGDRAEPGPADRRRRRARDPHRPKQGQRRAQGQLPGAADGREIGGRGLRVRELDAERQRAEPDDREGHPERRPDRAPATAPEPGDREQQGRPDEVELLLDRQRPQMQHRARFDVLGEVVDRLGGEVPVGGVEGRADDVA